MQKKLQRERTDQVNRYMRERGLGKALQRRIRAFYEYYLERKSVFDVAQMLEEVRRAAPRFATLRRALLRCAASAALCRRVSPRLATRLCVPSRPHTTSHDSTAPHRTAPHRTAPHRTAPHRTAPHRTAPLLSSQVSTTIKNELCSVMYKELVRDIPFFRERDASLVALICIKLEPFFVLAGEYICRKGVIGMEMYWVRPDATSHLSPRSSLLAPRTSHLAPRTSHLAPLTSHFAPLTSHLAPRTSHLAPLNSPSHSHLASTLSHAHAD